MFQPLQVMVASSIIKWGIHVQQLPAAIYSPVLHPLGQVLTATHQVSKPPFPWYEVGFKLRMSQLSGAKVSSQSTPTYSQRKPRPGSREESHTTLWWLSPDMWPAQPHLQLMAWVKQLCLCHQMNPPLLWGGHGDRKRALPTAPLHRQLAMCLGTGTQTLLNA